MVTEVSHQKYKQLYETDYNLWVLETVKQLQNRELDSLDWENLVDEVLELNKREKRKIENLLIKLFEHLLILQYWQAERERNRGPWEREIMSFRLQILRQLEDSPSLKNHLNEKFQQCYQDACKLASKYSQLPQDTFPKNAISFCNSPKGIAPLDQVLDENWLPDKLSS